MYKHSLTDVANSLFTRKLVNSVGFWMSCVKHINTLQCNAQIEFGMLIMDFCYIYLKFQIFTKAFLFAKIYIYREAMRFSGTQTFVLDFHCLPHFKVSIFERSNVPTNRLLCDEILVNLRENRWANYIIWMEKELCFQEKVILFFSLKFSTHHTDILRVAVFSFHFSSLFRKLNHIVQSFFSSWFR